MSGGVGLGIIYNTEMKKNVYLTTVCYSVFARWGVISTV